MPASDRVRLRHMLQAAREARTFAIDKTRADLEADRLLQLGLTRLIEIIGEAAAQVSEDTLHELSTLPWSKFVGMRNRLVHAY